MNSFGKISRNFSKNAPTSLFRNNSRNFDGTCFNILGILAETPLGCFLEIYFYCLMLIQEFQMWFTRFQRFYNKFHQTSSHMASLPFRIAPGRMSIESKAGNQNDAWSPQRKSMKSPLSAIEAKLLLFDSIKNRTHFPQQQQQHQGEIWFMVPGERKAQTWFCAFNLSFHAARTTSAAAAAVSDIE